MDRETPAGVCLAAGAGTRMGIPKALLDFDGRTALDLVLGALTEGGCDPVVLVLGAAADLVLARAAIPVGVEVTVNDRWEEGRSGSLHRALRAAPDAPAWVVLPVDHPLVTAGDVAKLVEAWRNGRPPVARAVCGGRGGHPVLLDASLEEEILRLGADEPLRNVVRSHRDGEVVVPCSPGTVLDVNTPEDHRRAAEAYARLTRRRREP